MCDFNKKNELYELLVELGFDEPSIKLAINKMIETKFIKYLPYNKIYLPIKYSQCDFVGKLMIVDIFNKLFRDV